MNYLRMTINLIAFSIILKIQLLIVEIKYIKQLIQKCLIYIGKYTLPEDNKTIFSSEYKLHMQTEQELISYVKEEKKNFELNEKK